MRSLSFLLLLLLASTCGAVAIFRCEDASSHVSLIQLGCSAEQVGETVVADGLLSRGRSVMPMAETKTKKASIGRKGVPLTVVGEGEGRRGRRLDKEERRKVIVEQRIMARTTHSDAERAPDKPDRVSGDGVEVRYRYRANKRRGARSASFDQEGYVRGKGRHRVEQVNPRS